ncbi:MAG: thermonuclease family protein [Candidatus Omnitrophica bacterium]|nr:thermonuclease family protein [Candidatus Omnitrophota bacterium]
MLQRFLAIGVIVILVLFSSAVQAEIIREIKETDTLVSQDGKLIRLIGVRTPLYRETMFPDFYGAETFNYLWNTVRGKEVKLEAESGRLSKEGSVLAYVYMPDGTMLNRELIRKGYACVKEEKFKFKYKKDFLEAEEEARKKVLGIWLWDRSEWDGSDFVKSDNTTLSRRERPEREETFDEFK